MRLSICMIVKNEEKNLGRCLESLISLRKAIDSELIIIDTGSQDRTVEIAKQYTDKVYFHQWNNNFADMRNISLSYAKGEWIMFMDADEAIEDATDIVEFLGSGTARKYDGAVVTMKNFSYEDRDDMFGYSPALRLFKNTPSAKFEGVIHENPKVNGPLLRLKTIFLHYGYISSDKEFTERKFLRNKTLLESELQKDPENIEHLYNLASVFQMHKDYQQALDLLEKAYNLLKSKKLDVKKYIFIYSDLVFTYIRTNKNDDAQKVALEGINAEPEHSDLYYAIGRIYTETGKFNEAIKYYEKYLDLLENLDNLSIRGNGMVRFAAVDRYNEVYLDLAYIYLEKGKYIEAQNYLSKANPDEKPEKAFTIAVKLYLDTKNFGELNKYYENKVLKMDKSEVQLFINSLEAYKESLSKDEKIKLLKEFSKGNSLYSDINKVRLSYEEKNNKLWDIDEFIIDKDIDNLAYSDFIYYLLEQQKSVTPILSKISENKLAFFMSHLGKNHKDLNQKIYDYINLQNGTSFEDIRAVKMLLFHLLNANFLNDKEYEQFFNSYVEDGIGYIKKIYNKEVLENEMIYDVKNEQEAFLIYMYHAQQKEQSNDIEYVKYLRKALNICPSMNKGIKILIKQYESQRKTQTEAMSEFEQYKIQIKNIINNLVNTNQLEQAKALIAEYRSLVKEDKDIDKIEAVIKSKENK